MAAEGFKNEFQSMNQDLARTKVPANAFFEAINFRPTTDKGLTDGALENIRGNIGLLSIPDIAAVQQIKLDLSILGPISIQIVHNGVAITSSTTFNLASTSTPENLYNFLINDVNFISAFGTLYNLYYNNLFLILNPLDLLPVIITPTFGLIIDDDFVSAQQNLEVIGSTYINNDIYLLTTNNSSVTPGRNSIAESVGQIWRLSVNNVSNTATPLELIYNNYLNFSTYNAIAPSAILGRYENSGIQRIFFSDFYNKLRSLNVSNPQAFALDVSLIDVVPAIDFDIPIMTNIGSAAGTAPIPIGCYQLAYKLSNVSGSSSSYSVPSNMIFVIPNTSSNPNASEELQTAGLNWDAYRGDVKGTTTTKRIEWTINSTDRDFERIEAVILIRETINGIPIIKRIFEGPITAKSETIIFDGDIYNSEDSINVSLSEYLAISNVFDKVKTLTTKDNRLIVGNISNFIDSELDYDARAYRFWAPANFNIIDVKGAPTATPYLILTPSDYDLIAEDSDAIAPYNLETTDPLFDATAAISKFKANGMTIGGEGKNISYEFVSIAVAADKIVEPVSPQPLPIVSTNPDYTQTKLNLNVFYSDENNVDNLQEYPTIFPSNINDGMKYPQMNSIYIGYQNNEIYRLGIQFYNKSKNPFFVKWIGDIKFPDYFDPCLPSNNVFEDGTSTGFSDYRKSFTLATPTTHGANQAYVCQLGIKINVNIPSDLTNQISGYSIVRVKREESDKKVIAEGLISNTASQFGTAGFFVPTGDMSYDNPNTFKSIISFITPNILNSSLIVPGAGMKLRASSKFVPSNTLQSVDIAGGYATTNKNKIYKMYTQIPLLNSFERNILFGSLIGTNGTLIESGNTYWNQGWFISGDEGQGNPAYILRLNSDIDPTATGTEKFFAYIYKETINQYGGDTYTDRGKNEYIMCSHFRSIKTKATNYSDSPLVFGGDVTNDIMDEQRMGVDWGSFPTTHNSTLFLYPASSTVNRRLRHGASPNDSMEDNGPAGDVTDYFYNKVYSCQNDILKFFPKPDPFISNSEHVNRFYISNVKINGEINDAWSVFPILNYWDVEGSYGPINGVSILQDQVYFIQDKAFGRLLVNPKTAITSVSGEEIQLGRGNVIDSHDYISVETGSTHQFSFLKSGNALYFIDARHNKMFQFSQGRPLNPLSDIKGMHSWFIKNIIGNLEVTDKPVYSDSTIGINGIHGVYDYINDELYYTIARGEQTPTPPSGEKPPPRQNYYTLVFNEKLGVFTGFYTHYPKNYITNNRSIISADPNNLQELFLHNFGDYGNFYGIENVSSITFTSNPNPEITKVFTNLMIQTDVQDGNTLIDTDSGATPIQESFNLLQTSNNHQTSSLTTLTPGNNLIRFFRTWRTEVPRNSISAAYVSPNLFARMMDKWLQVKLSFQNNNNKRLVLHNVVSFFRKHNPK